ncbi:MAG TPA: hypothetical protein VEO01_01730, partial [Pseudonocardiaceae bacterium]|nr:hypothetical protein [Pseudonocardiaceae bacterium]
RRGRVTVEQLGDTAQCVVAIAARAIATRNAGLAVRASPFAVDDNPQDTAWLRQAERGAPPA